MQRLLPHDHVGQHGAAAHHRRGGVVTTAFQSQYGQRGVHHSYPLRQSGPRGSTKAGRATISAVYMPAPILLLTRPRAASERLLSDIMAEGIRPESALISPLIDIVIDGRLPKMSQYRGLVFTSAAGVEAYDALHGPHRDVCFTVGHATAEAARAIGLNPVSADGNADALVALVLAADPVGPLLHLRGKHSCGEVAARLTSAGIETHSAVLYDQVQRPLNALAAQAMSRNRPIVAPVFSTRTAEALVGDGPFRAPLYLAAISRAVARPLQALSPVAMVTADQPNGAAMRKCILQLWSRAQSLEGREAGQ
ncbi:uroporphyrinogen-III synthase [Roseivivax sp. CAU 1753]